MEIKTLGIDLAKRVFQLHGVDAKEKTILKKRLSREALPSFMANLPSCTRGCSQNAAERSHRPL